LGRIVVEFNCIKTNDHQIFTWVINNWTDTDGWLTVIMVIATLNIVAYFSTVPLYFKGKSVRIWLQRTDLLAKAGLN